MPIPTQTDMFRIVLDFMNDDKEYSLKALHEKAGKELQLTDSEMAERLKSGSLTYVGRVDWAISYLYRGGLINRVSRGVYRINDFGKQQTQSTLVGADFSHWLDKHIAETNPWQRKQKSSGAVSDAEDAVSPEEQIQQLAEDLNSTLADELINMILDKEPYFFEKVVVDLLVAMGYGEGTVTQRSNDGGIDGMVVTDELGFNPIYTQAKRYQRDQKIDRPTIQGFIGALNGAPNGVFITTSSFTSTAIEAARSCHTSNIVLIDGQRFGELMVKHGLGVSCKATYTIKQIDSDYFEE